MSKCGGDRELNPASCACDDTVLPLHYAPTDAMIVGFEPTTGFGDLLLPTHVHDDRFSSMRLLYSILAGLSKLLALLQYGAGGVPDVADAILGKRLENWFRQVGTAREQIALLPVGGSCEKRGYFYR